ncbi:hypothetical protein KFL_003500110 [Klebsormidium nitens]|uniref:Neurochondrin family protein n=1 Tax=Klebsormidium nitens TaxID=105231 RepID=A0A1Y1ID82_KLENI|nr:hypothetical protein KFL_003500110 [Klebsormidium nitens]|eukprot:GAQ87399.1 hypothetical protein KFL_003500110 [Klebsormidium nitens]
MDLDKPHHSGQSQTPQPPVANPLEEQDQSSAEQASTSGRPQQPGGSLDECLALLRGGSDEQRLVGLLLATRFVSAGDLAAVEAVFDAVGWAFIGRLFRTGGGQPLSPYAALALSLVSAFVRVPRLAAATEAIERVPLFLGVVRGGADAGPVQDALECLLAVASASDEGLRVELESGGVAAVCQCLGRFTGGEEAWFLDGVRLLGTLLSGGAGKESFVQGGEVAVPVLAQEFAARTDMLVFECLGCLVGVLSHQQGVPETGKWEDDVRRGVQNLLQSKNVKAEHRLGALELARLMVEAKGENWLLGSMGNEGQSKMKGDNFLLVLLNTVRVEVAVQLNEVARALFGEKGTGVVAPALAEAVTSCYALLEAGVNALAEAAAADVSTVTRTTGKGSPKPQLSADTAQKAFGAASEAAAVVIDLLEQAKEHGRNSDDFVLASVRVLGRFLAEAPEAHREKVAGMLGFLLGVKGSDDSDGGQSGSDTGRRGPYLGGVWCLLPALGQISEDVEWCKIMVREKAHRAVGEFARDAIAAQRGQPAPASSSHDMDLEGGENLAEDPADGMIARALDVVLNVLDQQAAGGAKVRFADVSTVLPALLTWIRAAPESPLRLALSSAVISNALLLADEKTLGERGLDLGGLLDAVVRFLDESFAALKRDGTVFDQELWEITLAAAADLLEKFPGFESRVTSSRWMQEVGGDQLSRATMEHYSGHGALLNFLAAAAEREERGPS